METRQRKGRNAHGHNGTSSIDGAWRPANGDPCGDKPQNDELGPKPSGRVNSEKGIIMNQTDLNICTYNVRTLKSEEDLDTLLEEVDNIKWDIIGLAETRRKPNLIKLPQCGHTLFTTSATRGYNGVGFLVNKKIENNVLEYKEISDRIAYIKLQINRQHTMKIIQVYAPTTSHPDEVVEDLYNDIDEIFTTEKTSFTILMGDLNAKVGVRKDDEEKGVGPFGIGNRNDRGERLVDYVASRNLVIGNTCFKKPSDRYWTWESPNGATHNMIDYIITDHKRILMDVEVVPKVDTGSDHRFVRAKVRINKKWERMRRLKRTKKRHIDPGKLCDKQEQYQLNLQNRFALLEDLVDQEPLDVAYEQITSSIMEEAEKLAKSSREVVNIRDQGTEEIQKLNEKRKALKPFRQASAKNQIEYTELNKTIRKMRRNQKRKCRTKVVKEVLENNKGPKVINRKLEGGRQLLSSLKTKDGTIVTNKSHITETIEEFYRELYNTDQTDWRKEEDWNSRSEVVPPILKEEVANALHQMKKGKAPGEDQLTADILQLGGEETVNILTKLYNRILQLEQIPTQWNESKVIILFKKGDMKDIKNYRPISLLPHMYKVFTRIILARIQKQLDENQPREQAGFRAGFRTSDHLHALCQIIEKAKEYRFNICLGFVDYEKAFDSLDHASLLNALKNQVSDEKYIRIIKAIYKDPSAKIHLENTTTNAFNILKGVRQGDPISPKLFTATMEEIFKNLSWESKGIVINGENLTHLRFADDILLVSHDPQELQSMIRELSNESKKAGLNMNIKKTKVMLSRKLQNHLITVDGTRIENVESYIYLGKNITLDNDTPAEVARRIQLAWVKFGKLSIVFRDENLPLSLKTQLFDQCIIPVLSYGSETWTTTKKLEKKLRVTERAMERIMVGITRKDRVRNEDLRNKTNVRDIIQEIKTKKWRWAGHLARRCDNRWTHKITEWTPREQTRRRGRQSRRWMDDIREFGGVTWMRNAQDRGKWKVDEEAFLQQWSEIG